MAKSPTKKLSTSETRRNPSFRTELASPSDENHPPRAIDDKPSRLMAILTTAFVALALLVAVSPRLLLPTANLQPGMTWNAPALVSPFDFAVVDQTAADVQRERLEQIAPRVFVVETALDATSRNQVTRVREILAASGRATSATISQRLLDDAGASLAPESITTLQANVRNNRLWSDLDLLVTQIYNRRGMTVDPAVFDVSAREQRLTLLARQGDVLTPTTTTVETVLTYPERVRDYLEFVGLPRYNLSQDLQRAALDLLMQVLRPNIRYDRELTAQAREQMARVTNRPMLVQRGQVLVREGDTLNALTIATLTGLRSHVFQFNLLKLLGITVFLGLCFAMVFLYVRRFKVPLRFSSKDVLLVSLPVLIAISFGRLAVNLDFSPVIANFIFPAGMVGLIMVILFEARFALMMVMVSSLLFGIASGVNFATILVAVLGGFTGVAAMYQLKQRSDLLRAGVILAVVNAATAVATELLIQPDRVDFRVAYAGLLNGVACYLLATALLPVLEVLFGEATNMRLMELVSLSHPLLKDLEERAPGTFQHSLNVSKLSESAAEAINANVLLVRAGAMFHDIGKMVQPKYFTENQNTPEERAVHTKISPFLSARIIRNHVKHGLELARKHNLPAVVVDFIDRHHGTSLISYFYRKALRQAELEEQAAGRLSGNDGDSVAGLRAADLENEFRYVGRLPHSVETAIVMLADSVEATSTAKFSNKRIREIDVYQLVRQMIEDKFEDDQLTSSRLTMEQLEKIREAFIKALLARYHQRIDYDASLGSRRGPQGAVVTVPGLGEAGVGA